MSMGHPSAAQPRDDDTANLVREALDGDRAALERLFSRHRGRLVSWIGVVAPPNLARRVTADDLAQETLLEAARRLDRFEPRGPASFYAWLVGIARHKLMEAERAQGAEKRAREAPLEVEPTGFATSPTQAAMRADRAALLRAAMEKLGPAAAEALRLRYLEGRSTAEVAGLMRRSESAVKSLVTRAFADLARLLPQSLADSTHPPSPPQSTAGSEDMR